jgi:isoleucyl-tRNA synthetase
MSVLPPVSVGKTDFPLRPCALDHGPVPAFLSPGATSFRLLDGPPYANGAPHLGHVLNKHLKDAVARAANARGYDVEWRPGWDCHGLPLELAVEKQGVLRADRQAFVGAARAYASVQAQGQSAVFQQQGWSAQWQSPWHTQDPQMEAGTLRVLADLLDRGVLDVRFTSVPWCAACASTLSNAEQEEKSVTLPSWVVPFTLDDGSALLSWTTTPWTLPLHRALVVNPEASYVLLALGEHRAWVSADTATQWSQALGASVLPETMTGSELAGRPYHTPWKTNGVVVADNAAQPQFGTGVLHAVPGLSELDTALGAKHGWGLLQHLSPSGRVELSPCVEENDVPAGPKANAVVRPYYENNPWFHELPYTAELSHCWRHHTPLLTRASRQVFLRLDDSVRSRAEEMVARMSFTPEGGRNRLLGAMRNRPDWCVSRQRTWGVPLALFLDKATGQPHPKASSWMRRVADQVAVDGVEAWWSQPSSAWLEGEADPSTLERVDDVLDVWFDSGCVPQLLGSSDVVVEGTDQHRGWFQSCLWLAAALDAPLPFQRVVTHGFVLDYSGSKLSKSKGGDQKPSKGPKLATWNELPTDVVRVWALSGTEGHDKAWTTETVQAAQGALARWRGVLRFLLANALPQPQNENLMAQLPAWDRYWWQRTQATTAKVLDLVAHARTGEAVSLALEFGEEFSAQAVGSWKDRLYCAPASTVERQALDLAVRGCLLSWGCMLEVLAPRTRLEAQPFWPEMGAHLTPKVTTSEVEDVERVRAMRLALAPANEELAKQKGGGGTRRLAGWDGAPEWPSQTMADAFDVGQFGGSTEGLDPVPVTVLGQKMTVYLGRSMDPVCPRCRRAQSLWAEHCCQVCADRTGELQSSCP